MSLDHKFLYEFADVDERDFRYSVNSIDSSKFAVNSGKLNYVNPVYKVEDQGNASSCTAFTVTTAFERLVQVHCGDNDFQASSLFNYTQSRLLDSTDLNEDTGTTLRSACGNLRLTGVPRDITWPYTYANFRCIPSPEAYKEANHLSKAVDYFEINRNKAVMKHVIGDLGYFVMIGFAVYSSYYTISSTGDIPYPDLSKESLLGGHALCIVGWDDDRQVYIVLNNYSNVWGKNGLGSIPYKYIEDKSLVSEAKVFLPRDNFTNIYQEFKSSAQADMGANCNTCKTVSSYFIWIMFFILVISVFALGTFIVLWLKHPN